MKTANTTNTTNTANFRIPKRIKIGDITAKVNTKTATTVGQLMVATLIDGNGKTVLYTEGRSKGQQVKIAIIAASANNGDSDMWFFLNNSTTQNDILKIFNAASNHAVVYNELEDILWIIKGKFLPWDIKHATNREYRAVDTDCFFGWIEETCGIKDERKIKRAINTLENANAINPLIERLENLPAWDGIPRAETLAIKFLGADDTWYNREMMKLHMLGALARAYFPGCKYDTALVLVGEKGGGKSSFFEQLFLAISGESWYNPKFEYSANSTDDRRVEALKGCWACEMAEIKGNYDTTNGLKGFISTKRHIWHKNYNRDGRACSTPTRWVFNATTNNIHFISDTTGDRRWLPIMIHKDKAEVWICDKSRYSNAPLEGKEMYKEDVAEYFEQAWAEIMEIFKTGNYSLTVSPELDALLEELKADKFEVVDARLEAISYYLIHRKMEWDDAERLRIANGYRNVAPDERPSPDPLPKHISVKEIFEVALKQPQSKLMTTAQGNQIAEYLDNSLKEFVTKCEKRQRCGRFGDRCVCWDINEDAVRQFNMDHETIEFDSEPLGDDVPF